ncbi:MAG: phage holin family protein [Candidatus Gastranaerophilaceae bacterium]
MLSIFLRWIIYSILIVLTAWIIPGIEVDNFFSAMLVCLVIGFINVFIRPLLETISLPVNFLTLGLFSLVINALLLMLAGAITPGFEVEGFFSAFFGAILLAILASVINKI